MKREKVILGTDLRDVLKKLNNSSDFGDVLKKLTNWRVSNPLSVAGWVFLVHMVCLVYKVQCSRFEV